MWRRYGSKYNNKKVTVEGIAFDSLHESRRYMELKLLEKAGEISGLALQVPFELIPTQREPDTIGKRGGKIKGKVIEKAVIYVADFTYFDKSGNYHVEDAKGFKTPEYRIKKKLMLWHKGIRIEEV